MRSTDKTDVSALFDMPYPLCMIEFKATGE
jgi:hypothetical protein